MTRRPQCFVAVVALLAGPLLAAGGSISGQMTDPQGKAVSGATLRLVRKTDGGRTELKTGDQGRFVFEVLDAGAYTMAEGAGFRPVSKDVVVASEQALQL